MYSNEREQRIIKYTSSYILIELYMLINIKRLIMKMSTMQLKNICLSSHFVALNSGR